MQPPPGARDRSRQKAHLLQAAARQSRAPARPAERRRPRQRPGAQSWSACRRQRHPPRRRRSKHGPPRSQKASLACLAALTTGTRSRQMRRCNSHQVVHRPLAQEVPSGAICSISAPYTYHVCDGCAAVQRRGHAPTLISCIPQELARREWTASLTVARWLNEACAGCAGAVRGFGGANACDHLRAHMRRLVALLLSNAVTHTLAALSRAVQVSNFEASACALCCRLPAAGGPTEGAAGQAGGGPRESIRLQRSQ